MILSSKIANFISALFSPRETTSNGDSPILIDYATLWANGIGYNADNPWRLDIDPKCEPEATIRRRQYEELKALEGQ